MEDSRQLGKSLTKGGAGGSDARATDKGQQSTGDGRAPGGGQRQRTTTDKKTADEDGQGQWMATDGGRAPVKTADGNANCTMGDYGRLRTTRG